MISRSSRWPPFIKDGHQRAAHTSGWPPYYLGGHARVTPPATFRPHMLGPCNFPSPIFISQHLVALGSFLGLLADHLLVPHPEASKALPSSGPKNEPKGSHRDISGFMHRGIFI